MIFLTRFLFAWLLLTSFTAVAATEPVLDVTVKRGRVRQRTRVYEGHDGWYCRTERTPHRPVSDKPGFLLLMQDRREPTKGCHETFTAQLVEKTQVKYWSGCRKGDAAKFLDALAKECRGRRR